MLNKFGKTLTIFAALIVVLLVSSTSIGFFLYHKEAESRKAAESERDVSRANESKVRTELQAVKQQMVILQDKNKEADEKINSLLDEMELVEGVRDELKNENASLKAQADGFNKVKEKMKFDLDGANGQVVRLQEELNIEQKRGRDLQANLRDLEEIKKDLEAKVFRQQNTGEEPGITMQGGDQLQLDKIVVNPQEGIKGRVLSVDKEAEFVICNLGFKQGVHSADVLSVYRGEEYLGDIKATRVQDEMSAADLIPPFSSRKVRKNDIVILKQ